mgnify:CR=1 FL=1
MADLSNWKQIEAAVLSAVNKAADTVGEVGEQQLKNSIDDIVYKHPVHPYEYERTYELRESVEYDSLPISKGIQVEIYHNLHQIYPHDAPENSKWGQHQSFDGEDVSIYIPEWTVGGHGGAYTMPPRDYFTDAEEKLKNGLIEKAIKEGLRKNGLG